MPLPHVRALPAPLCFAATITIASPAAPARQAPPAAASPVRPAWEALERGDAAASAAMAGLIDHDRLGATDLAAWRRVARLAAVRAGNPDLLRRANAFRGHRAAAEARLVRDADRYRRAGAEPLVREALARVSAPHLLDDETRAALRALRSSGGPRPGGGGGGITAAGEASDRVAQAAEFLLAGEPPTARAILRGVPAPASLSAPAEFRRLSLLAHLERLEGAAAERLALETLLAHVGAWSVEEGRGRRAGVEGDPPADLTRWWAGVRYAELLTTQGGDAAAAVAREAEQRLAGDPPPAEAAGLTLRLAFAMAAAGNPAARDAHLRSLPWPAAAMSSLAAYP